MPSKEIQWFPGHMAKTRRIMAECLPLVDAVIEILDARIPRSSQNPEIDRICAGKTRLILLSKATLADPAVTSEWKAYFLKNQKGCLVTDFITGAGLREVVPELEKLCAATRERYEKKGMTGKALRAMVVGIPNVGKSSFINKITGAKKAKVEDRPGVTLEKQWVKTPYRLELLDMPGVLWPKFDDRTVAENLALTGAIKDQILNVEDLAAALCSRLAAVEPAAFFARYSLSDELRDACRGYELLEAVGRRRGYLLKGGEVDTERTARMLLDELRSGRIGRISLERPKRAAKPDGPTAGASITSPEAGLPVPDAEKDESED